MPQVIAVPGSVTVRSAEQFAQDLLAGFGADQDTVLDVSSLVEVDIAFLEIIFAARLQWAHAGRELRLLHAAAGPVAALLRRAGFLTDPTPQDIDFWFHGELPQ